MKFQLMTAIAMMALLTACKKDKQDEITNPANPNEEELITTFRVTFTDSAGVLPDEIVQFVDLDGPGGNDPTTFDTIRLQSNTTWNASIALLNESVTPVEDITEEVEEEGVDHLFCFGTTAGLNVTIERTDLDANSLPIGLLSKWTTTGSSTGTTTIRLRHQPGVKDGTCDPGETDIELDFHTIVE
jgi:hypothetical protein